MNRRLIPVVALSTLAVTASTALAAAPAPKTGSWTSKKDESGEFVSFKVAKTKSGTYEATSTRAVVAAGCDAPNPRNSTAVREIKASGVTVKLAKSGSQLKGSKTVARKVSGGKATETVKIAMTFTGAKRATVVVKAAYKTKVTNPKSNADNCSSRLSVTAAPK